MAKVVILFINVYEGIRKEKIDLTFKRAMFEEFLVVAEGAYFVGNPVNENGTHSGDILEVSDHT